MGAHSVTCRLTQVNTSCFNLSHRPILDLPTLEGWKAELTYVTIPRKFTRPPQTVTRPYTRTNLAVHIQGTVIVTRDSRLKDRCDCHQEQTKYVWSQDASLFDPALIEKGQIHNL